MTLQEAYALGHALGLVEGGWWNDAVEILRRLDVFKTVVSEIESGVISTTNQLSEQLTNLAIQNTLEIPFSEIEERILGGEMDPDIVQASTEEDLEITDVANTYDEVLDAKSREDYDPETGLSR